MTGSTSVRSARAAARAATGSAGAVSGSVSSGSRARTSGFLTFSVWVRGRSSSGQTVIPRIRWCGARRSFASPDDLRRQRRVLEEEHRVDPQVGSRWPADDRGIGQAGVQAEDRLDVLGVDLLPVRQGQHVLLPAAEDEETLGRDLAEVAGVVPAVGVDDRGGRRRVVPVAEEPVLAASEDLAVVGDPHLDPGDRLADRARAVAAGPGEGDHRPHLGGAIALEDVDPHLHPALGQVHLHGRGTDSDRVEAPADRREHRLEDDPSGALRQPAGDRDGAARSRPGARTGRPAARWRCRAAEDPGAR